MVTRVLISVTVLVCSLGPSPGQGNEASPGNPPAVLIASEIDADEHLVLVEYRTIYIQPAGPLGGGGPRENERSLSRVPLKGVKIYSVNGKEVTVEAARKRLGGKDTPILASSWGEQLPPFYRSVFRADTLLFVFPKDAPTWKTIQSPSTPVRR